MAPTHPLEEKDMNVDVTKGLSLPYEKKNRNVWTEKHRLALVNQTYLDDCCPIGKRNHKQVGATWKSLIAAIKTHPDGLFEGFDVSVEAIRRQLGTMMKQQRKRNQEALLATGLGGARVHTDLEAGVQHLLDLQDCVKEERAAEREGKSAKLARLDEQAKDALKRSMETHVKRSSGSGPKRKSSGASGIDFDARMAAAAEFACVAMEEFVERNARIEWVEQMKLHATHPALADHPGPKDAWIQSAIEKHRKKMENVATSKQGRAPEVNSEIDEMEPSEAT